MNKFLVTPRFFLVMLSMIILPLLTSAQGNGNAFGLMGTIPGAGNASFKARPMQQDSVSATGGLPHHCQVKFELPDSIQVAAIHIEIAKPGNSGKVRQSRIPLIGKSRRYKNIGVIRHGNTIWLDFGLLRGNPNYTATVQLENAQGQLSAAVDVAAQ